MPRPHLVPSIAAIIMLLIAIADQPYGFYTAMRWVVMIAAGVTMYLTSSPP